MTCTKCGDTLQLASEKAVGRCVLCEADAAYEAKLAPLVDKKGAFVVVLSSCGNPAFRQDPSRSLPGVPKKRVRVATLKAASEVCRLYRERYELGAGNWNGGQVYDQTKKQVAQISYNGRAWNPGPWPQPEISL